MIWIVNHSDHHIACPSPRPQSCSGRIKAGEEHIHSGAINSVRTIKHGPTCLCLGCMETIPAADMSEDQYAYWLRFGADEFVHPSPSFTPVYA